MTDNALLRRYIAAARHHARCEAIRRSGRQPGYPTDEARLAAARSRNPRRRVPFPEIYRNRAGLEIDPALWDRAYRAADAYYRQRDEARPAAGRSLYPRAMATPEGRKIPLAAFRAALAVCRKHPDRMFRGWNWFETEGLWITREVMRGIHDRINARGALAALTQEPNR